MKEKGKEVTGNFDAGISHSEMRSLCEEIGELIHPAFSLTDAELNTLREKFGRLTSLMEGGHGRGKN